MMREIKGKKFGEIMSQEKDDKIFPCLYMDFDNLPEAKDWEVGEEYTVTLKVRMTSVHQDERGPKDGSVGFDVVGVDAGEEKPKRASRKDSKEDY